MLSVENKPFMLSVVMLNVIMLNGVVPERRGARSACCDTHNGTQDNDTDHKVKVLFMLHVVMLSVVGLGQQVATPITTLRIMTLIIRSKCCYAECRK
jgi:hypothetical protein